MIRSINETRNAFATYDPIDPTVDPGSVCHTIFTRAHAEPITRRRHRRSPQGKLPSLDGTVVVFDTETVDHRLTFGVVELYEHHKLDKRAVFYADDMPTRNPQAFERLKRICRTLDVNLVSREWFFQQAMWPARKHGWIVVGFNPAYDFSRVADAFDRATRTGRLGTRFCNGFGFQKHFTTKDGKQTPVFLRIKRDDRHHVRYDLRKGVVLDLATFAFAYTDRNHSLESACHTFGVEFDDRPGAHSGEVTPENVAGCLYDVQKTSELLWALEAEHQKHPINLHPSRAQSGASIAKAYLDAVGARPRFLVQPNFPKPYLGYAAQAYFGGRVESRIHPPVPCVYMDYVSMYPTVFTLLGLWETAVTPATLEIEKIPRHEIEELIARVRRDPDMLLNQASWRSLSFFALVNPNGARLPVRTFARSKTRAELERGADHLMVTIGPVESKEPLWYAGPDLAAAAADPNGGMPRVVRAWRLRPKGKLDTLTSINFRGVDPIDPRTDDFFARLIELRKAKTNDQLDDDRRSTGYKVVANSGAYGDFAETNPIDVDPDENERKQRRVAVFADKTFETEVDRPERHGRYCFWPIASLVTAAARLMLDVGIRLVERAGGEVAYCDTDSLAVVSSKAGGFIPCAGGPYRLRDSTRAVRALSWAEVEAIRERFADLNPYDRSIIRGSILKLEDENFTDAARKQRCELWCYAVGEKLYALFTMLGDGEVCVRKYSSHVLGQYRSPIEGDRHEWIVDAWKREIRAALGYQVAAFGWEQLPAISQLTISTWTVMQPYLRNQTLRPFDFLAVGTVSHSLADIASRPSVCCKEPRPACALFTNPADWRAQEWRCLQCGARWDFDRFPRLRTYGDVIRSSLRGVQRKRLYADGSELNSAAMRGITIPRPVRVESMTRIGKEIIVDPTDTDEGLTAELLSATSVLEYHDPSDKRDDLRARIKFVGVSRVARESGVSRSTVKAFVNQGTMSRRSTISKLESAIPKTV